MSDNNQLGNTELSPVLKFQLDMLKKEVEEVNATIRQGDDITKSIKQWAITIWAAALGSALVRPDLRPYAWTTAILPILFWLVDTWHRIVQRRFIWRSLVVMDFLNDDRLVRSFKEGKIVGFNIMDIGSRRDQSPEFLNFIGWRRVMLFRTFSILYLGLSLISITAWIIFLLKSR